MKAMRNIDNEKETKVSPSDTFLRHSPLDEMTSQAISTIFNDSQEA